jgi:hypothetical protein
VKLALRYPATAENAVEHARLATKLMAERHDVALDFGESSLEDVDAEIESLREEGFSGEDVAEVLFVLGCYVGEVLVRQLGGQWIPSNRSPLRGLCPWPMVVVLPGGSAWDAIGKAYARLELGDAECVSSFFALAAATARRP